MVAPLANHQKTREAKISLSFDVIFDSLSDGRGGEASGRIAKGTWT